MIIESKRNNKKYKANIDHQSTRTKAVNWACHDSFVPARNLVHSRHPFVGTLETLVIRIGNEGTKFKKTDQITQ